MCCCVSTFRCAGLQREVASLKGKLKTNKAKLKESEGRLTGVVAMREDYERIQSSMQSDLHAMKEKVGMGMGMGMRQCY